ncbi:signal responsive 1 [Actinidia rufa]|uniref:Signal responsive 1 n=1 Tax=Actinidia rufa TaxID=165716 RepID=A0A7J0EPD9_9ERIC|nr:signal responsive 1 [Actinidia rufa]
MAESRRYGLGTQLDIEQILLEAQHRWLRPAEICEILRNFKKFRIAPEPAHKPPSGSLFLFDRKVLRYFRKDGHNWRKKKDGKTVKEAHERLKAGSIDVLHCYYAHGEENENFQRRSYWLLEEEHSHIVLVHYREVKGHRANFNRIKEAEETILNSQESEEIVSNSEVYSSVSSKFNPHNYQVTSQTTDTSLNSTQASEYEDAESDDYLGKLPGISGMDFGSLSEGEKGKTSVNAALTYPSEKHLDLPSWEDVLENSGTGIQSVPFQPSLSANRPDIMSFNSGRGNESRGQFFSEGFSTKQEVVSYPHHQDKGQTSEDDSSHISKWSMDQKFHKDSSYHLISGLHGRGHNVDLLHSVGPQHEHPSDQNNYYTQTDFQMHLTYGEGGSAMKSELDSNLTVEEKDEPSPLKQPLLDGLLKEGLKKLDSFDRWMTKELGDVNESHLQSSSGTYWETVEAEDGVDDSSIASQAHLGAYMLGPSLSQDQLFSIIDFSPNWAYAGSEIKVLITGKFLKSQQDLEKMQVVMYVWRSRTLHWAASCGRERTVGFLISLDAAPGALTDPTPIHPGQTPADLAASNGHKGIAGYLAESSLSSHLSSLQLKDTKEGGSGETSGMKVVQTVSERTATPIMDADLAHGLSLKDSLAAVCNATQAAARIHQVFRVQSFQRKQIKEYGDDKFGMSEERALALVAVKSKSRLGHREEPVQAAAIRIQNKFRSWKGRKEFLTIRQQIVKIQAHVRGHQVRKNYRKIIWSVGIVEKVILRWRRKGSGLRGFKQEAFTQASSKNTSSKEDDYDFLKEGRKQTEERLEKALARVKSMVQYPEARDQYRRLLNVVTEMQETKAVYDKVLNSTEEAADFDDDLIDLEALLDDDTFMPTVS